MTQDRQDGDGSDQLRDEAAIWFARMRGPDAVAHQAAFQLWLARGAVHRAAYNRIAEVFAAGKLLKQHERRPDVPRANRFAWAAIALPVLVLVVGALYWLQPRESERRQSATSDLVQYANMVGGLRRVRLSDGSKVVLDSDTLIG
jgi:transmembrane sensor